MCCFVSGNIVLITVDDASVIVIVYHVHESSDARTAILFAVN